MTYATTCKHQIACIFIYILSHAQYGPSFKLYYKYNCKFTTCIHSEAGVRWHREAYLSGESALSTNIIVIMSRELSGNGMLYDGSEISDTKP